MAGVMTVPVLAEKKKKGAKLEKGFVALFDGESTDQWMNAGSGKFPAKGWVIEDGCLKHAAKGGGGDILTKVPGSVHNDSCVEEESALLFAGAPLYQITDFHSLISSIFQSLGIFANPGASIQAAKALAHATVQKVPLIFSRSSEPFILYVTPGSIILNCRLAFL